MLKQQNDIDIDVHLNYLVEMNIFMYIMFTKFRIMHKIRSLTLAEVAGPRLGWNHGRAGYSQPNHLCSEGAVVSHPELCSLGWFDPTCAGNSHIWWELPRFPIDFPTLSTLVWLVSPLSHPIVPASAFGTTDSAHHKAFCLHLASRVEAAELPPRPLVTTSWNLRFPHAHIPFVGPINFHHVPNRLPKSKLFCTQLLSLTPKNPPKNPSINGSRWLQEVEQQGVLGAQGTSWQLHGPATEPPCFQRPCQ